MKSYFKEENKINFLFFFVAVIFVLWSVYKPSGYFIWILEVFPAIFAIIFIVFFSEYFKFSNLLFRIICLHIIVLAVGGHYTYAKVPLFNDLRDLFEMNRNEFDKVGHFFQGVTPTLLAKEIIFKKSNLRKGFWVSFFAISCALSFSAFYEILEWAVAVSSGVGEEFVSLQGDIWDAQKDMFVALIGAILADYFSRKYYKNEIRK